MFTLVDYLEQYIKKEGLSGKIPDYRKQFVLRTNIALIWFMGTWALDVVFHWLLLGSKKLVFALVIPWIILFFLFLLIAGYYVIKQVKSKSLQKPSAPRIGTVFLFYYPILLIISFGLTTQKLFGTVLLIVSYVVLIAILFLENETFILHTVMEIVRIFLGIFAKSLSILLTMIPLLLVIILISVFSQDFWLILGNISWAKLIAVIIIFSIPVITLSLLRLQNETIKLIGEFPPLSEIPKLFSEIGFFTNKFQKGLISDREWSKLNDDLLWRNVRKIKEENQPQLFKEILLRLAIFSEITNLLLILTFFSYFMLVFYFLITPETISAWTGVNLFYIPIHFLPFNLNFTILSTVISTIKVSLILSVIVSLTARISILTDNDFRANVLSWLERKARNWIASFIIYDCVLMSNFQLWRYRVKNKRVFNVDILLKPGLELSNIEATCHSATRMANKNVKIIRITGFEAEVGRENYDIEIPDKRWGLLINRTNQIVQFNNESLEFGEYIRTKDNLGFELLDKKTEIPDEWFGNDATAINLGKAVWESDLDHNLILHPYVDKTSQNFLCEICLTRRLENSSQYKALIKSFLNIALITLPNFDSILIQLFYHKTTKVLASLDYIIATKQVVYKDELTKKYLYSNPEKWII